jgi:glycosyltransferase involved in cell wall biosynthesis
MNPSVCCVCLTADRHAFTDRAVRCFNAQTYENRWMLIFDTGIVPYALPKDIDCSRVAICYDQQPRGMRIGALRNVANGAALRHDIIAHWDSDDWSHPDRLEIQAATLAIGPYGGTGFSSMVICDTRAVAWLYTYRQAGRVLGSRAWLYTYRQAGRVLGSSLMYPYDLWAQHPFPEGKTEGEEINWPDQRGVHATGGFADVPLMVAEYHGGNTGQYGKADNCPVIFDQTPAQLTQNPQWRRVPDYDEFCRKVLY